MDHNINRRSNFFAGMTVVHKLVAIRTFVMFQCRRELTLSIFYSGSFLLQQVESLFV